MDRDTTQKKMKAMYKKATEARKAGKAVVARSFMKGARRLERELRTMPKPVKAPEGDKAAAPAAS